MSAATLNNFTHFYTCAVDDVTKRFDLIDLKRTRCFATSAFTYA